VHRLPALRARLAELSGLRSEYEAMNKRHLLTFIDHLIDDVRREIGDIERNQGTAPE
jgi:hypothetical protein